VAITTEVCAGVWTIRRSARASPILFNVAVLIATVTIDAVTIVALILAEVETISANLCAYCSTCRRASRAIPAELNFAIRVAAVTISVVAIIAIVGPWEVEREADAVTTDLGADILGVRSSAGTKPASLDLTSR